MKSAVVFAALFLASTPALASPPTYSELPADLAAAARGYDSAQIKADGAALNRLLADDYTLVNSRGKTYDKKAFIADLTSPGGAQPDFTVEQPVEKVWSGGAVLGGVVNETIALDGKSVTIALHFADVWAKRNGQWQVIFTQVTRAPD
jgi:hypothetical protein